MTAILLLVAAVVGLARADTPANCSYEGKRTNESKFVCPALSLMSV